MFELKHCCFGKSVTLVLSLRILHVAYIYPPALKVADGITNVVYNATKKLAKRGHQVAVFTLNLADLCSAALLLLNTIANGVSVFCFRYLLKHKTFTFTLSMI
jgi:hypothetical protein